MSIQETVRKGFKRKIILRFRLSRIVKFPAYAKEIVSRYLKYDSLCVFFRYQHISLDTHIWFDRYYRRPPIKYCNFKKAKAYHWISFPDVIDEKPFVMEVNDHPLSIVGVLPCFPTEPRDVLVKKDEAIEKVYQNPSCKKIIVESSGQWELYERYCPDILSKCEIIRLGTIPKIVAFDKIYTNETEISFLCLASDFLRKGVDLLLDAWLEFTDRHQHKLIIACPSIPDEYKSKVNNENVELILKAPLTINEKDELYRRADVVVGPLHVDGGGNILEAFEYGLPIITMRCQRSQDQIMNQNGIVVDVPFYFYDEGYGVEWPTWDSFFKILNDSKEKGGFDVTKEGFVKAFQFFSDHPDKIKEMGRGSYNLAINEYSLVRRNIRLVEVYQEIIGS